MNREDRRAWGCARHRPFIPIVATTCTLPENAKDEVTVQLGQVLCAVCKEPPLIKEIQVDRQPKSPSRIWTPPTAVN